MVSEEGWGVNGSSTLATCDLQGVIIQGIFMVTFGVGMSLTMSE